MTESREFVPPGSQLLTPYVCPREAAKAIDWYAEIFGAVETHQRFSEPDGRVGHASLSIGGAQLMISDAYPDYGVVSPEQGNATATFALSIYVPDVDETMHAAEQAGATIQRPAEDQPYGDRMGTLIDPFGVRWMIGARVRDLGAPEMEALAREYSGTQPGPVQ